jgi:hypothetical protein
MVPSFFIGILLANELLYLIIGQSRLAIQLLHFINVGPGYRLILTAVLIMSHTKTPPLT